MFKQSIRNKLIAFLLAATLLPIVISIVITYLYTQQTVSKETAATNRSLLFQGKTNINNYLDGLRQTSLLIYSDIGQYPVRETGLFSILDNAYLQNDDAIFTSEKEIYRGLQTISHSTKGIRLVYLYMQKSGRAFSVFNEFFGRGNNPEVNMPPAFTGDMAFTPPHPGWDYNLSSFTEPSKAPVISLYRRLYNSVTGENLGILAIDSDPSILRSICGQLYDARYEEVYILDNFGTVVYAPRPEEEGTVLGQSWVAEVRDAKGGQGSIDVREKEFSGLIMYERIQGPDIDWTLVKRIPYSRLNQSARQLTQINTLVFVIFLIVALLATIYVSFRFTQPIRRLSEYMTKINTGQLNVDIEIKGHDELAMLGRRFRTMMKTINDLILREYRLEIANKTNELKALQAQINPHFMNNALQSIGTLALQNNDRSMYQLINALGKMMRYSMNTNETIVPLSQEIDYLKSYLALQKQRFGEELQQQIVMDPGLANVPVPKMTLQPLAENYFKHGFTHPAANGGAKEFRVVCRNDGHGYLVIEIEDNGVTFEPCELEELQEKLEQPNGENSGIGLSNVYSRLYLYYDNKARMELYAVQPAGFGVRLCIPLIQPIPGGTSV